MIELGGGAGEVVVVVVTVVAATAGRRTVGAVVGSDVVVGAGGTVVVVEVTAVDCGVLAGISIAGVDEVALLIRVAAKPDEATPIVTTRITTAVLRVRIVGKLRPTATGSLFSSGTRIGGRRCPILPIGSCQAMT
jgi:hypothetical protein